MAEDSNTYTLREAGEPKAPMGAVVRVVDDDTTRAPYTFEVGRCLIGSAPGCDVVIEDRTVSRRHVELELVPEGVMVHDLGSRNGTFYLGQKIERATLALGVSLRVGGRTVIVDPDIASANAEYTGTEYRGVLGASAPMRRIFSLLARLEGSLVSVLVEGPSGVGKERIARAIHDGSRVESGPFVALNCGGIPKDLVASELFGHKKGAFTGAAEQRLGAFESAESGTLFLDEIGELPLDVQPILLRVLDTGEMRAVGSDALRRVSVRVIAATNRRLEDEVAAGCFREDLFYRLAVVRVNVPPLSERLEDVNLLARAFAAEAEEELSETVLAQLRARAYPGNARELRNAVHAYLALGALPEASRTRVDLLDAALRQIIDVHQPYQKLKTDLQDRFLKIYITLLLAEVGGNQAAAARLAGLDRTYLGRLLQKLGIRA